MLFLYRGAKYLSKSFGARMEKLFDFFPGKYSSQMVSHLVSTRAKFVQRSI